MSGYDLTLHSTPITPLQDFQIIYLFWWFATSKLYQFNQESLP
ncbi:hypothetical protein NSP_39590 [Nodularia spumigena CCY9414]|nr:hypothetical protein NSP_39590 [Nodularia spumigena CCY9414]